MVGKVVGKRRKRPLPDSRLADSKAGPWNINMGSVAMPSPASTHVSELSNKRNRMSNDWTSLISYDGQSPLDFSACDEQFLNLDLCQEASSSSINDSSFMMNTGLPTPSMSPPEMQFVTPPDIESFSRQDSGGRHQDPSIPTQYVMRSQSGHQQAYIIEDDETVCLRLLHHLKRCSSQQRQPLQLVLSLVHRANATIKRLLRSRTIKSDYTCHLLLTSIMLHLASIYEHTSRTLQQQQQKAFSDQEFINECCLVDNEHEGPSESTRQDAQPADSTASVKGFVQESMLLCSSIGDLLKRKPLNGFQTLGRHESALIEVGLRFKRVMSNVS